MKVDISDLVKIAKNSGEDIEVEKIKSDSLLHDFFDSLTLMDFLLNIEDQFHVDTSQFTVEKGRTFSQLIEFISTQKSS